MLMVQKLVSSQTIHFIASFCNWMFIQYFCILSSSLFNFIFPQIKNLYHRPSPPALLSVFSVFLRGCSFHPLLLTLFSLFVNSHIKNIPNFVISTSRSMYSHFTSFPLHCYNPTLTCIDTFVFYLFLSAYSSRFIQHLAWFCFNTSKVILSIVLSQLKSVVAWR